MTKKKRKKRVLRNLRLSPRVGRGGKETKENLKKKTDEGNFFLFFRRHGNWRVSGSHNQTSTWGSLGAILVAVAAAAAVVAAVVAAANVVAVVGGGGVDGRLPISTARWHRRRTGSVMPRRRTVALNGYAAVRDGIPREFIFLLSSR